MGKIRPILLEAFRSPREAVQFRVLTDIPKISLGSAGGEKENQDRVAAIEYIPDDRARGFRLFAVADGVGGLSAGGKCAEAALAALTEQMLLSNARDIGVRLGDAFRLANKRIFSTFRGESATTLSVLAISGSGRLVTGSVGDSRIYRYSTASSPSKLEQLTEDDTIGRQVALAKGQTPPQTSAGGVLGQLTQAIGSAEEIFPTVTSVRYVDGDEYILATDGFHSVGRENMLKVLNNSSRPLQAMERLTHLARWLGTKDDISSVFVGSIIGTADTEQDTQVPGGSIRIHTLHGTFLNFGVDEMLTQELPVEKPSKQPVDETKKRRRRTAKKRNRPAKKRNGAKNDDIIYSQTDEKDKGEDAAPQQELEINYVGENKK